MGICRRQSDARIEHHISSPLSSSYPSFCRLVIPVSSSSYPRSSRSIARCILVVLFVVVVLYPHHLHIGIVHLEDPRRRHRARHHAPQCSHPFAYGCVIQIASVCKRESAGYFPWVKNHLQTGGSHLQTGGVCKRGVTARVLVRLG